MIFLPWVKDYFDEKPEEENKIPTYFKALNEEFDLVIKALTGIYDHDEKDQYRFYTIANKLIREYSNHILDNTLNAEELTLGADKQRLLHESVKQAHDDMKIASFTLLVL